MNAIYQAGLALALDQNLTPAAAHRAALNHRFYYDPYGNITHRDDPLAASFVQGDGQEGERDAYGWIEPDNVTLPQHIRTMLADTPHDYPQTDVEIVAFCRNRGIIRKDIKRLVATYWEIIENDK